jgi:hypothetical protein
MAAALIMIISRRSFAYRQIVPYIEKHKCCAHMHVLRPHSPLTTSFRAVP